MDKAHILIVEDEALLYRRLCKVLEKEHYSVGEYAPSVADAIACINTRRPDIVLLDIKLQGELTGINLGKRLNEVYKIPFIYITEFDDDQTFYNGLNTNHEDFIIKTKPQFEPKEIIRAIQNVLNRNKNSETLPIHIGINGLVDYLDKIKVYGNSTVSRIPIEYKDIAFFTVKPFINKKMDEEKLRDNYLWFLTKSEEHYFLKSSLRDIQKELPYYFVRINESYIVNISAEILKGRINGSRISVMDRVLTVKDTYRKEFNKRYKVLYKS